MTQELALTDYIRKAVAAAPVEAKIIQRVYNALKKAGTPIVSVWDGDQDNPVTTLAELNTQVFNLDEAHLYTESGAWVFVVMGQDWDTIADYTISLEDALEPVNEWIHKNWG